MSAQLLSPDAVARLQTVFALADTDYDGFVSYSEFLFFLKLLASMSGAVRRRSRRGGGQAALSDR